MQVFDQQEQPAQDSVPATAHNAAARAVDAARASSSQLELFGSFILGGEEYALPAASIREVVNYPTKIIPVPLAPHFLEGVFTLRGHVIPVLNLARIFDPAAPRADGTGKIAIIEQDEIQIGILFENTGEMLRVRPEQRSMLQYDQHGAGGVVAGTILLDNGARLLQILDARALVRIENVPQVQALRAATRGVDKTLFKQQADRRKCVSFHAGGCAFAFDIGAIREIIMVPELQPSVMQGRLCVGRMNFRGHPVAVVDFAVLLQSPERAPGPEGARRILIAHLGDALIGLLVDSVDSIFSFQAGDVLPVPLLSGARAGMFAGCVSPPDHGDLLLIDHAGILSHAELLELSAGHINLYRQEAADAAGQSAALRKAQREVYIVFTVDLPWAVKIGQLHEIVPLAESMVCPPGLPACVRGILNLRHQMISVIDLRSLFGLAPAEHMANARILILERGTERFGLIVDAVENIISISASDRRASPRMLAGGDATRTTMREVIDISGPDGQAQTLSVFDPDCFFDMIDAVMAAPHITVEPA